VFQKNVTTFSRYNSDVRESILTIFGTNVTENVGNQKYIIFLPHLTSTSALPGEMKKGKNSISSLKRCTVGLPDFNQSLV